MRRSRLGGTRATIVFDLQGEGGGLYSLRIQEDGHSEGSAGDHHEVDLRVRVDLVTWRLLNSGALSAPEALLCRRVTLEGDLMLGLKLHVILGP